MRKNLSRLGLAVFAVLAMAASGIDLNTAVRTELTDCISTGSTPALTLVRGTSYLMRVTDADTFICWAASGSTCGSGGEKFPTGTVLLFTATGDKVSVSCRSASSTGDVIFTQSR